MRPDGRYFGIDPGLASVGWGIIAVKGAKLGLVECGTMRTEPSTAHGDRLLAIYAFFREKIRSIRPVAAGMEALYFAKNISSALPVSEAMGVIRLAFAQEEVDLKEYPPVAIKMAVVGDGRAEKRQVEDMVRLVLGSDALIPGDHAADALAAAICRANDPSAFT